MSAFNNSGMSLLDANMVSITIDIAWSYSIDFVNQVAFQTSIFMLITMGLLILAGNTWYVPKGLIRVDNC